MKKILIHALNFSPDGVSTAYLYNDIAKSFQTAGYEIVVLSTTPQSNIVEEQIMLQPIRWKFFPFYKVSDYHGIKVYHVPQKKFKRTFLRLTGFVFWHLVSFFIGLSIRNVDVIISPSPPLTLGWLNIVLGRLKKCKVVYNVQEIYPDILGLSHENVVYKVLSKMEKKVYDNSDAVTTIDQVFYDTIAPRFADKSKLHIIPNFVDTDLYNPFATIDILDRSLFPESESLKVMYAGNIGYAQDWDTLLHLAKKTALDDIEYYIIGNGVTKPYLVEKKREYELSKIHILDYQPRSLMPSIIAYSDLQFIFMSSQMEKQGFPSKIYTIMACGKPILVSASNDTPLAKFLEGRDCAKVISEKDLDKRTDEMAHWLRNSSRESLSEIGISGYNEIVRDYSKGTVTNQYIHLITSLCD